METTRSRLLKPERIQENSQPTTGKSLVTCAYLLIDTHHYHYYIPLLQCESIERDQLILYIQVQRQPHECNFDEMT